MSAHHQGDPLGTHGTAGEPTAASGTARHGTSPRNQPRTATQQRFGVDASRLSTLVRICTTGVLLMVCAVLAESTVDAIPDDPIIGVFTPLRLLIITGIALALAARPDLWALRTRLDIWLLLLLGWAAVSVAFFGGAGSAWRNLFTGIAVYYLVVLARRCGGRPMDLAIFAAATIAVVTSSLVGVMQTVNEVPTGFCRSLLETANESCEDPDTIVRAMGTTTNPNLLAAMILLLGPFAGWITVRITDYYLRTVAFASLAVVALALLFTVSRIALFAALVSFGVFFILRNPTTTRLLLGVAAAVLIVSGWAVAVLAGGGLGLRSDLYVASYRIMRDHIWGVGIGNAGETLQAYVPNTLPFAHAHNLWLNWLIELGPVGALLWVVITVVVLLHVVKAAKAGSAQAPYIGAALAAFFIASLFDHAANTGRLAYVMWFVFAVATSLPTTISAERDLDEDHRYEDYPDGGERPQQYHRDDVGVAAMAGHFAAAEHAYNEGDEFDETHNHSITLPDAHAEASAKFAGNESAQRRAREEENNLAECDLVSATPRRTRAQRRSPTAERAAASAQSAGSRGPGKTPSAANSSGLWHRRPSQPRRDSLHPGTHDSARRVSETSAVDQPRHDVVTSSRRPQTPATNNETAPSNNVRLSWERAAERGESTVQDQRSAQNSTMRPNVTPNFRRER